MGAHRADAGAAVGQATRAAGGRAPAVRVAVAVTTGRAAQRVVVRGAVVATTGQALVDVMIVQRGAAPTVDEVGAGMDLGMSEVQGLGAVETGSRRSGESARVHSPMRNDAPLKSTPAGAPLV